MGTGPGNYSQVLRTTEEKDAVNLAPASVVEDTASDDEELGVSLREPAFRVDCKRPQVDGTEETCRGRPTFVFLDCME